MSKPKTLETIDPAALAQVSGGKATGSSDDSSAVMTALTGIMDSLKSLASSRQSSGFGAQEMMLMMMMQQRSGGAQVVASPQPTNWTWDANGGYWIVK